MPRTPTYRDALAIAREADGRDGYFEKLAKYVPAEALAPYLPLAALAAKDWQVWALIVAGELLAVGFVYAYGSHLATDKKPRWYYYVLAAIAFPIWAIGASGVTADLFGIDDQTAGFVLGFAAFVIPGVDVIASKYYDGRAPQ